MKAICMTIITLGLAISAAGAVQAASGTPWILRAQDGGSRVADAYDTPFLPGQLAVFDAWFGKSTHTLAPVTEAIVVNGRIVEIRTDGNAAIPAGGFVISTDDPWLEDHLRSGHSVSLDMNADAGKPITLTHSLNGINRVRDTDMLIAYTPGKRTTGTNEWGLEAIIRNGIVTAVGGNNSPIPSDGFVLSGHGTSGEWLTGTLNPGMRVTFDKGQVTVVSDPGTYMDAAGLTLATAETALAKNKEKGLETSPRAEDAVNAAKGLLVQGKAALAEGRIQEAVDAGFRADRIAVTAISKLYPSPDREMRAVWMRCAEDSIEGINRTLDGLAAANINTIFPEVFYGGRTLYPSSLTDQLPEYEGWDPLAAWVTGAHARGIEVHAWVHVFNLGEGNPGPILDQHPDWAAVQRDGEWASTQEPGLYYGDPAHPGVQGFLSDLLREMAVKYPLDGIELDYIRYPTGSDIPQYSFSYSQFSRQAFKETYGTDPLELTASNKLWSKWSEWRQGTVTAFVRRVRGELKAVNPELKLSAAIFGDFKEARSTKMQDWPLWTDEGLMDFVSPMLYSTDAVSVGSGAKKILARIGEGAGLVPGIAPFMGLDGITLLAQVDALRSAGSQGVSLFALHSLRGGQLGVLAEGPFRNKAVPGK